MIQLLENREHGRQPPERIVKAETTRRATSMELSKYMDVQKIFDAPVNTLDIDAVENRYLLAGAANGVIVIYDLHNVSGEPRCTFPMVCTAGKSNRYRHKHSVETVQWFPIDTGMFLSSGTDKLLKVWDTNALKTADEFEFSSIIYSHHMSPIAKAHSLVAVACQSAKIRLIDLKTGSATHTLRGHNEEVYCCKWSPTQEYVVASGSADRKVMLWDIRSAKGCLTTFDRTKEDKDARPNTAHDGLVNGLCFTDDGMNLITAGTDNCLRTWNVALGTSTKIRYRKIRNQNSKCLKMTVARDTKPRIVYVPSGSDILGLDVDSGATLCLLRGHYNQVNGCVYNSEEQTLLSSGNDRNILVWTPYTSCIEAFDEHLDEQAKTKSRRVPGGFVSRNAATADAWSSDED